MKILIDFTQIPVQRAGVGVYAENLVRELPSLLHPDDELFLLVQKDEVTLPRLLAGAKNVKFLFIAASLFRNRAALMIFEQLILPCLLLVHRMDVLHSLHYTVPIWTPSARVVTFHDLTMLLWPRMHTWGRRMLMPLYIRMAWRGADAIIFVSAATRDDAERLLPLRKGQDDQVVPLGIDFASFARPSEDDCRNGLNGLGIAQPYVLFIGTIEPRKNLLRVIKAFEDIAAQFPDHILVIVGKLGWDFEPVLEAIARSPYVDRIRRIGYISEEIKRVLLTNCSALIYPSLYEGFGLPVLEGMAAGAPVITSNVSSLPEVVGPAALMVDPESVDQLSAAMVRLLTDPELATTLSRLGQERSKTFSWEKTAAGTYQAYQIANNKAAIDPVVY